MLKKFNLDADELEFAVDNENLDQIKEARMASKKAIDMLMADIKKKKKVNVWVPGGDQSHVFHTNAGSPSKEHLLNRALNNRYKSKKF